MMTRQNGVDLESSGKIEIFQERSFREKKKEKRNAKSVVTCNPKRIMGNREEK